MLFQRVRLFTAPCLMPVPGPRPTPADRSLMAWENKSGLPGAARSAPALPSQPGTDTLNAIQSAINSADKQTRQLPAHA